MDVLKVLVIGACLQLSLFFGTATHPVGDRADVFMDQSFPVSRSATTAKKMLQATDPTPTADDSINTTDVAIMTTGNIVTPTPADSIDARDDAIMTTDNIVTPSAADFIDATDVAIKTTDNIVTHTAADSIDETDVAIITADNILTPTAADSIGTTDVSIMTTDINVTPTAADSIGATDVAIMTTAPITTNANPTAHEVSPADGSSKAISSDMVKYGIGATTPAVRIHRYIEPGATDDFLSSLWDLFAAQPTTTAPNNRFTTKLTPTEARVKRNPWILGEECRKMKKTTTSTKLSDIATTTMKPSIGCFLLDLMSKGVVVREPTGTLFPLYF